METPTDNKGKAGKKKATVAICLAALAVVVAIAVFVAWNRSHHREGAQESANAASSQAVSSDPGESGNAEAKTIKTPVGELSLPQEWGDSVETKEDLSGNTGSIEFDSKVGNDKVTLFTLVFGGQQDGYYVGYLPDQDGNEISVYLEISEIEADPSWSEDETKQVNDLQGGVNDLLDQIRNIQGFVSSDESGTSTEN